MSERFITLFVNGEQYHLEIGESPWMVRPSHNLAYTLRENLELTGTKVGCNKGECGSCTVLIEGKPVLSCLTLTVECDRKKIITIEGLEDPQTGELDPLQEAFAQSGAFQCGFCTPGMILSVKALLGVNAAPVEKDIKEALSGHYCRCISHYHVLDAVARALKKAGE